MIKVASYNMRKGIGLDRRRDPARVLAVLGELDADIVALQEADRRFGARASAIPPQMFAEHSDYVPVDLRGGRPDAIGWHGNALLVRKGAEIEESHRSEEHTSELQSLMRISYAVFCLKNKTRERHHRYRVTYNSHIKNN